MKMPTLEENKQQIKDILFSLGEEALNRSHNSVNLSFAQMLAFIKPLHEADLAEEIKLPEEIKCLLDTYQQMAEKFYTQFELSLLTKIEEQREIQQIAVKVVEKIKNSGELGSEEVEKANQMLSSAYANADSTYKDLVKRFPALLQEALDKLRTEWQRLDTIALSNQALGRDEPLLRALEAVVKAAAYSVGIEKDRIVIVPSNAFALYFFSYLDNLAVLTVPIPSVRAPWEWSIFWHELAGYQVRQLRNQVTIENLKSKLKEFYDYYKAEERRPEMQSLLDVMTRTNANQKDESSRRRNRFGQRYLNDLFSRPRLVLNDMGSLEYQFQQMLKNLKMKNKFQTYDEIKAQGWCVEWFEELFEDSFSVMFIGEPFLDFFQDILSRNPVDDGRHPPLDVRLKVAKELLRLMSSEAAPKEPTTVEESAAQQILKFISLLNVASHPLHQEDAYDLSEYKNVVRYDLPEVVGVEIGSSILDWSNRFLGAKDRVMDAREEAEQFIQMFAMEDLEFISIFAKDIKHELTPSFETLLAGRDYERLLDLSFYKRDLFSGLDVKNVARLVKMNGGMWAWQSMFSTIQSTTIVDSLMTSTGDIRFKINSTEYQTTITNWDNIFPQGNTYYIGP
jgi:hypothetical protein